MEFKDPAIFLIRNYEDGSIIDALLVEKEDLKLVQEIARSVDCDRDIWEDIVDYGDGSNTIFEALDYQQIKYSSNISVHSYEW